MTLKSIKNINLEGVKVLLRVDFNVSLDGLEIEDDFRIRAALPTIKYLIKNKAKLTIITHLGRPNGVFDKSLSVEKIAKRLESYLGVEVSFVSDCIGSGVSKSVLSLENGGVLMLENLRFYKEEELNDLTFSQKLAKPFEVYINDAFSVSHRSHASVFGVSHFLPSYAGFLMEKEVEVLSNVYLNPKKPLLVAVGGAKVKTKLKLVKRFLKKADNIVLGGIIANIILKEKGVSVGASKLDKGVFSGIDLLSKKIKLPIDFVVSKNEESDVFIKDANNISDDDVIFDVGPLSMKCFSDIVKDAGTIVWNGPFGYFELDKFSNGTDSFARALALSNAFTIVGGGDSISALDKNNLTNKIDFISTGGGAMLEFLAGESMPGIDPLIKRKFNIFNIFKFKKNGKI